MQINLLWCAPYLIKEHYYPGGSKLNLSFWRGHNPWEQVLETPCTWTTFHSWSWIQRRPQNVMYKKHSSHSLSQSFFVHRENCLWPYVGYFWYFVISCICVFVFVYLTVGNISFDVLGPWAFKKYSIIRYSGHGDDDDKRTNNRVNLVQVCSLNIEQSRLLQ